jgi:hypothetical protein
VAPFFTLEEIMKVIMNLTLTRNIIILTITKEEHPWVLERIFQEIETYLSFGYRYAQTSYMELNYNNQDVTYKNYYNRLEAKFGFKF